MDVRTVTRSRSYWNAVGTRWKKRPRQALWRAHSDAVNAAWLAQLLPTTPIDRLLKTDLFDEAFSTGLYPLLAERTRRLIGIDTSAQVIAAARARNEALCAVVSDVRSLPFCAGAFDCVVSNSTLDHFASHDDISRSLAELHRVLRPGGTLLITLDNGDNPLVALRNRLPFALLSRLGIVPYFVGTTCGRAELVQRLRQTGFAPRGDADFLMHCPRILAVALARLLERVAPPSVQEQFLRGLRHFERLGSWRFAHRSGYFVAVVAEKPASPHQC